MTKYPSYGRVAAIPRTIVTLALAYLALTVVLSHQASAQCGPPGYTCSSTSTSNYTGYPTALSAIFSGSNVINDTNVDTTLNPSYDCYTVLATTGVGNVTHSGGANDVDWSKNGTYVMLQMLGSSVIYHINTVASTSNCPNGATQIVNTTSYLQPLYCKSGTSCTESNLASGHPNTTATSGPLAFSRATDNIVYFLQGYTTLWKMTITSDTSITSEFMFDFAAVGSCPEITSSTPPAQSASILSVTATDSQFGVALSFTGGQGTATQYFAYKPSSGCALIDAATGNWYSFCASSCSTVPPSGTETVCNGANNPAGQGFHDGQMSLNGGWAKISNGSGYPHNTGSSTVCTTPPGSGFYFNWEIATGTVIITSGDDNDVGHESVGFNHSLAQFFPKPNIRQLSDPTSFTQFVQLPSPMGNSIHGTWTHSKGDDVNGSANVWVNVDSNHPTCCGISDTSPTYLNNEIFGLFPNATDATPVRFGHTFNDENSTSFGCLNGINNTSQDGRFLVFGTSMFGNWSGCGAAIVLLQ